MLISSFLSLDEEDIIYLLVLKTFYILHWELP